MGVEIRRYGIEDKVAALARVLDLPVITSFMGRGLLADAEVPPAGTYLGIAGEPEITRLVEAMLEPGRVSETLARYVAAAKRRPRG